jgi:hypothetical protein
MTPDSEKLIAQMYLNQQQMMEEIRALRAQLEGHPAIADGWMNAKDAAISLKTHGIKSARQLQKLRLDGVFSESKREVWNESNGKRPTWLYHVPSCRKALQRRFRGVRALG